MIEGWQVDKLQRLWAKYDAQSNDFHPLICHMIDVGQVALNMWNIALPDLTRRQLSDWLDLDTVETGKLIAFWSSLHDIGKASPAFQAKVPDAIPRIKQVGFTFPTQFSKPAPHGVISTWALHQILPEVMCMQPGEDYLIACALGGHHGSWPTPDRLGPTSIMISDKGDQSWDQARKLLVQALFERYRPPEQINLPTSTLQRNAFLTILSGLVSVVDWIGSMSEYFGYRKIPVDLDNYMLQSQKLAECALQQLRWTGWESSGETVSFESMFPFIQNPHPIQKVVIHLASNIQLPALIIIEAPTGIGKTEMALYVADTWLQQARGKGIYIAMPTTATSNQMFDRVTNFLSGRYPNDFVNLHLIHGATMLDVHEPHAKLADVADDDQLMSNGSVQAATWFLPRKRSLLAPFGVGTVDQALLSVLQTRHFFVRLFGLGQKVVIFDEIHAYDTYMSELFQRLLFWLHSIDTSVILLSATLPDKSRNDLCDAWLGRKQDKVSSVDYPRLTIVSQSKIDFIKLPQPPSQRVYIRKIESDVRSVIQTLREELQNGGCAAVICNRVARAQEIYLALKEAEIVESEYLLLFHARFPYMWRQEVEQKTLQLFSKNGTRPQKAIIVATQVIEQSLDLDFDLMISDLAPIDLLLQRAGRLHRHIQNDVLRPTGLRQPVLILMKPEIMDGIPIFGKDEFVYDRAILLRTWLGLKDKTYLILPQETRQLIESVYGDFPVMDMQDPNITAEVLSAQRKAANKHRIEVATAKSRIIARPDDEGLLLDANQNLEEENPEVHQAFRALTRLGEPGISVICLYQTNYGLALDPLGTGAPIDLDRLPPSDLVKQFLRRSVQIQNRSLVDHFMKTAPPSSWKDIATLRHHYLAIFDKEGKYDVSEIGKKLILSKEIGLEIQDR